MDPSVEIEPASIAQVHRTKRDRLVAVDDDVSNVVKDLKAIDEALCVRFDPDQDFFVVFERRVLGDGSVSEHLVTTAQALDQRIVARVREISRPGYDYATELEKVEEAGRRARDHELSEQIGPVGERLHHAICKDLGMDQDRIFVPGWGH